MFASCAICTTATSTSSASTLLPVPICTSLQLPFSTLRNHGTAVCYDFHFHSASTLQCLSALFSSCFPAVFQNNGTSVVCHKDSFKTSRSTSERQSKHSGLTLPHQQSTHSYRIQTFMIYCGHLLSYANAFQISSAPPGDH